MLTIYKASAGSGKTFTLAVQYLSLLVKNPQCYRNILAVTFTNKATEEMKQRILSQLYGLWKGLPDSAGYARQVEHATGMGRDMVAARAGMALSAMIHHYSLFRVETIDAFFQTVLRGVARELGMTANWRLGLNDREVEEAAVDQLVDDLADDRLLRKWVMTFILERMADDRSWNVINLLKDFGENIFRDFYKQEREALAVVLQQEGFFEQYVKDLRQLAATTRQRMVQLSEGFQQACDALGLADTDFYQGKNGVPGHFRKLSSDKADEAEANSYVQRCLDDEGQWPSAKSRQRDAVVGLAAEWLPLLKESLTLPPLLRVCDAVLRHLHLLRLLGRIQERVENLNHDSNRLLLSDTQQRLAAIIDHSDTPFIYEKIGTRLEHVMIDEFQDTSRAQWQNFRLLLDETMSHSVSHNLIVGDVKQSIYRWRGGDWQLLQQIDDEFSPTQRQQLSLVTLQTNWRSDRRVVEFNNAFFRLAAEREALGDAYGDVEQQVPADKPDAGRIVVTLFPQEGLASGEGDADAPLSYHDTTLEALYRQVSRLLEQGAAPSDIAILVRYNRHIPQIARLFVDRMPDVPIVSDEAFRLDASLSVTTLIQLITALLRPDDQLAVATAAATLGDKGAVAQLIDQRDEWLRKPLPDLLEALVMHFSLNLMPGQSAYLCAFMDQVAAYQRDHTGDLRLFLDEWERHIAAKTVQTDAIEGIRLLSIHRSKGLEFPHVLIPFCDWEMEDARTLLWCHVDEQPFARLPLIPVSYARERLRGTVFEPFAEREHLQNVVDNLNLLYVAFTRAKHGLYVYGLRTKPSKTRRKAPAHRSWLIEQCLPTLHANLPESTLDGLDTPDAPLCFAWEAKCPPSPHKRTAAPEIKADRQPNPFLASYTPIEVPFTSHPADHLLVRQSNDSHRFIAASRADEGDDAQQGRQRYIDQGLLLHDALSRVATIDDVPRAFRQLELSGVFASHQEALRLQRLVEQRMKDPRVAEWFAPPQPSADGTPPRPRWQLFRECSILTPKPPTGGLAEHHRPDRVMTDGRRTIVIDYKFGRPNADYVEQVRSYMRLLRQMQMPAVEGYLWFVYTGDVVPVSMD